MDSNDHLRMFRVLELKDRNKALNVEPLGKRASAGPDMQTKQTGGTSNNAASIISAMV